MNKVPQCPNCKTKLETARQTEESLYRFNSKTGKYDDTGYGNLDVTCDCGNDLTDEIFPDGIINF